MCALFGLLGAPRRVVVGRVGRVGRVGVRVWRVLVLGALRRIVGRWRGGVGWRVVCRRLRRGVLALRRLGGRRGRRREAGGARRRRCGAVGHRDERVGLRRDRVVCALLDVPLGGGVHQAALQIVEQLAGLDDGLVCGGEVVEARLIAEREAGVQESRLFEVVVDEQVHLGGRELRFRRRRCGHRLVVSTVAARGAVRLFPRSCARRLAMGFEQQVRAVLDRVVALPRGTRVLLGLVLGFSGLLALLRAVARLGVGAAPAGSALAYPYLVVVPGDVLWYPWYVRVRRAQD